MPSSELNGPADQAPDQAVVVVLVEPAGPLNVGSVARLCANFGIEELRLVQPRCDPLAEEARRMAVHALPLLERAALYPDLAAAIADCHRVVATSGRLEPEPVPVGLPADLLPWLQAGVASGERAALVFGREDHGLSNDELLQAGRILRIPTDPAYPSMNLSHAVAVILQSLRHGGPARPQQLPEPASRGSLEAALVDAEALLLEVGFLLPHTAHARMAKLRALLQRAQVGSDEVALLRGMVSQLRWASRGQTP
ncbi:RNA methyltransferase [Synechococcus sp. CS-602]|uniref:RNA methyltransferase n=1 Tax=Synechococcaceae TaxID=1890426 RepID=UPI0008FF68A4|nr:MULTISPECIES: RNA methyltransferase [Synechococcaceae]MCT4365491.1 RNA methyltransferase [Candidatus Regnicoccus frigidus MAG-AL1]APD47482.1 rRNA methyltransferase [Synechococcus sp. SynAce01]MCT0202557.1 RNA methyltransferase [Synechococcus sp. CS-603]MCT0204361.1 RNA methyltransferase [Synechococcus sp. CS-602]MCT0247203.1 RNA methyltransferase [Synechococcus sp. CS-601]